MNINKYLRLLAISKLSKTKILSWYNIIKNNESFTKTDIEEYQLIELKKLLNHVNENVPFYTNLFRKMNFSVTDVNSIKDIEELPPLTKSIISDNFNLLLPKNLHKINYQKRSTGGTTGVPHKYYSDMNSWALHWALKLRAFEEAEYKLGEKMAILAGASLVPEQKPGLKRTVWNKLQGFFPMSMTSYSDNDLLTYYEYIKKNNIKFLRGYPTAIFQFADFIKRKSLQVLDIRAVFTTAEVLQSEHRNVIEEVFDCKVFDQYGCADGGGHAFECDQHSGLHWAFEASILQGVTHNENDGTEEIMLTNLTNYAMPVIRYKPGDMIIRKVNRCDCGKDSEVIQEIIGRSTEIIKFSNGKKLSGPAFTLIFRKFNLSQYQIVQNTADSIDINIVPNSSFKEQEIHQIHDIMNFHTGEDIKININKLDYIKPAPSGKFRFIISNL